MKKNLLFYGMILLIAMVGLYSCEKPMPTGDFTSSVDGFDVTFTTSDITEVTDYLWDFGDDSTSTDASPVHTYLLSGTYTVTLTLTGAGGSITVNHDVEILPDFLELLTGGPGATNGKTWILDPVYHPETDGGSGVDPTFQLIFASQDSLLSAIGYPEEYDNEYTFFADGKYVVDNINGKSVANLYYCWGGAEPFVYTAESGGLNIAVQDYTAPENSTWTLHEDDFVMTAAPYGGEPETPVTFDVPFSGMKWLELSDGAYFGILDFPTSRKYIIREITNDRMVVALFMAGYWSTMDGSCPNPVLMYHQTYIPKQ